MNDQIEKHFSLKSGLMIGIQMIRIINIFHNSEYIHRDIKPDNFVIGNQENDNKIILLDYGLCQKYIVGGQHIQMI
jgi:serine/threonine protein kinase